MPSSSVTSIGSPEWQRPRQPRRPRQPARRCVCADHRRLFRKGQVVVRSSGSCASSTATTCTGGSVCPPSTRPPDEREERPGRGPGAPCGRTGSARDDADPHRRAVDGHHADAGVRVGHVDPGARQGRVEVLAAVVEDRLAVLAPDVARGPLTWSVNDGPSSVRRARRTPGSSTATGRR